MVTSYDHKGFFSKILKFRFSKKLGLDAIFTSWDLKNRIPRRKLRIQSYSQVETRQFRSKYVKIHAFRNFEILKSLIFRKTSTLRYFDLNWRVFTWE